MRALGALERARVLRRTRELIVDRREEIAAIMTAEQGKPLAGAHGEVDDLATQGGISHERSAG